MSNIKLSGHTWDTSGIYDAEQEKTQKEVNADVSELKTALSDMILPGNLIDPETCDFAQLATDGTTTASNVYMFSDYIKVSGGETLYKSGTIYRTAKYSANKTWIANVTLTDGYIVPDDAEYIRVCAATAEVRDGLVVTRNPLKVNKVGAYPPINISGINLDKDASAFISKNNTKTRNKIVPTTLASSGCAILFSNKYTADEAVSVYGINVTAGVLDLRITTEPYTLNGVTAIKLLFYIPDITKTTSVSAEIGHATISIASAALKQGWNEIVDYTYARILPSSDSYTSVRFVAAGSIGNSIYLTRISLHSADKANLILIQDGGYLGFYEHAYSTLKTNGIPVTWALDPGMIGVRDDVFSQAQVEALAKDGNSEFSFHCWNANEQATASMTASEIQDDAAKCLHYLRSNGICPDHVWRAAHAQNNAPNASAEIGMVEALATGSGNSALNVFPFREKWNVPRVALHSLTQSQMDTMFTKLEKTHSTLVCYTHNIGTGTYDMSAENFAYFVSKVQTGMTNGWLRATTYSRLMDTPEVWLDLS